MGEQYEPFTRAAESASTTWVEDEFSAWLDQCGSCDAGLPMDCTCPPGDPRAVILALVERLDAALAICNERNPRTGKQRSIVNPDRLRSVLLGQPDPFPKPEGGAS
jgi:hypothetical protein